MKKQLFAWLLALSAAISTVPAGAADEGAPFTAKTGNAALEEITVTPGGYTPYEQDGTARSPVDVYTITLPDGAETVELSFDDELLACGYADGALFLGGGWETPASSATVWVDANMDGFADYIRVQSPPDEDGSTETLYAVTFSRGDLEPPLPFTGIAAKWYRDAAVYVARAGWMDSVGENLFGGEADAPRGTVIDAIWRMAGRPLAGTSVGYADVDANDPRHAAIDWAVEQGIVKGFGDGRIGADDAVTREQLAALLYRYAQKQGGGFSGTHMLVLNTADHDEVGTWALEGACWLYQNGVMTGRGAYFAPREHVTRAELAAALMKFAAVDTRRN